MERRSPKVSSIFAAAMPVWMDAWMHKCMIDWMIEYKGQLMTVPYLYVPHR